MNTLGTDVNLDMNIQEMKGAYQHKRIMPDRLG